MTDTTAPVAQDLTITLGDLQNFLNIIDVAARRGAFAGEELTNVGAVRDKLAAFLADVAAKNEAALAAQAATAETTEAAPVKKPAAKKGKKTA